MVLYFNSLVLPAVGGHAEPSTIRAPTPSLRLPAVSPRSPPPPTRVSNAPHRAAPCRGRRGGGCGGRDGTRAALPGEFRGETPAPAPLTERRRGRPAALGRGAARRSAPCAPPGSHRARSCSPGLLSPPRSAVPGGGPGQEGVRARSVRLQKSHLLYFFFFLPFPPVLWTVQPMTVLWLFMILQPRQQKLTSLYPWPFSSVPKFSSYRIVCFQDTTHTVLNCNTCQKIRLKAPQLGDYPPQKTPNKPQVVFFFSYAIVGSSAWCILLTCCRKTGSKKTTFFLFCLFVFFCTGNSSIAFANGTSRRVPLCGNLSLRPRTFGLPSLLPPNTMRPSAGPELEGGEQRGVGPASSPPRPAVMLWHHAGSPIAVRIGNRR